MIGFILRALIAAVGLWIATRIVPGISAESWRTLLFAAILLGVANAIIRPILIILTLPFTIITLGLFLLVINGLMLELVAFFLRDFHVHGLWTAILGSIVVSITGWIGSAFIGSQGRYELVRRR
jgi:putative membrane protein